MNQAITVELQFFLISILWGGILLLVYDVLRILRRLIKHDSFILAVEDLIFWVAASLFIFAMMYRQNNGIIRGFSVMGMTIGMVLYHYMFSEIFVNYITKFISMLLRPIAIAMNKGKKFAQFVFRKGKKVVNFLFQRLKKWTKSVKITLNNRKKALNIEKQKRNEIKRKIKAEQKIKAGQKTKEVKNIEEEKKRKQDKKLKVAQK